MVQAANISQAGLEQNELLNRTRLVGRRSVQAQSVRRNSDWQKKEANAKKANEQYAGDVQRLHQAAQGRGELSQVMNLIVSDLTG